MARPQTRPHSRILTASTLAACFAAGVLQDRAQAQVQNPAPSAKAPESLTVALGLYQRGLFSEAENYLGRFLSDHPDHPSAGEAHYRLGVCQLERGDSAENRSVAVKSFAQALVIGGESFRYMAECRYRLALTLQSSGRIEDAVKQSEKLVTSLPEDHYLLAPASFVHGESLRDAGQDEAAASAFDRAAQVAKTRLANAEASEEVNAEDATFLFPAYYQSAFCNMRVGALDAAAARFRAAADVADLSANDAPAEAEAECHYLAGDALLRAEQPQEAAKDFAAVLATDGAKGFRDDARLGLAWCALSLDDTERALAGFREVMADGRPELATQARLEVGRLLYKRGEMAEAITVLDPLLDEAGSTPASPNGNGSNPEGEESTASAFDPAPALEVRGLARLADGRFEASREDLANALTRAGSDRAAQARLTLALGEASTALEDWANAKANYDAVLALGGASEGEAASVLTDSLRGDALYGACLARHRLGEFVSSRELAEQLLAVLPKHRLARNARFAVGENLFAEERFEAAVRAFDAVGEGEDDLAHKAPFKAAWSAYLASKAADAKVRFESLASAENAPAVIREESLSMAALAAFESGDADSALALSDRFAANYADSQFLARTERVAARVLQSREELDAAAERLGRAAAAAGRTGDEGQASADRLEQAEVLFAKGDFEGAQALFAGLAGNQEAAGTKALEGAAWCAFELGDDAASLDRIQAGLNHPGLDPARRASLLELQSALHHRAEAWPEAVAAAERFFNECEDVAPARKRSMRYAMGVALSYGDDLPRAISTLAPLVDDEEFDRRGRACYEFAWALRRAGRNEEGLKAFARFAGVDRRPRARR